MRFRLVPAHHPAVAGHVGGEDRGEPAFYLRYFGRPALIKEPESLSKSGWFL
jgi:hypothetical protein